MKALITGVNGFVGTYLEDLLLSQNIEVWGSSRQKLDYPNNKLNRIQLDFNSEDSIVNSINELEPDLIFHLAAQSSVKKSWDNITSTLESNIISSSRLYEAIRQSTVANTVKILSVGSSEEYGIVSRDNIPICEDAVLNPINPYGISKVSQYMLAKLYCSFGMHIVHVRSFNHIGPGQGLGFVAADFSNQIARIESGLMDPTLSVGNLSAKRDFLDVRDIVHAYSKIIFSGISGEVYNICSGIPIAISEMLEILVELSTCEIEIKINPDLMRSVDIPLYVGSNEKIKDLINWSQHFSIEKTLEDTLNFWRKRIQNEG